MSGEGGFAEQEVPADQPAEPRPQSTSAGEQQLDPATTEVVLRRAFEIAHREPRRELVFSRSTLAEIATEVDLPVQAVAAALAEQMADGSDDQSFLDRLVGPDRISVHRSAPVSEEDMRDRALRLLEVGHGMRPRVQHDGVVIATRRKDLVGKLATTVRDAQGIGQLGKLRRIDVAAVDVGDEPGALVLSADIGDKRANAVAGGAAVGALGTAACVGLVVVSPFALIGAPVAIAAGVLTSRLVHGTSERDAREDLEEAADSLVRGDEPDGLVSRSARKALESLRGARRGRRR